MFESIYVGKGRSTRCLDHATKDFGNSLKRNKFNKIRSEGFDLIKFVDIVNESYSEQECFEFERSLIKEIGRIGELNGTLTNVHEGGLGGDTFTANPNLDIIKLKLSMIPSNKKGKTYEEIYGELANLQKQKRRLANLGVTHSEERIRKSSDSRKGMRPANAYIYKIKNVLTGEIFSLFGNKEIEEFKTNYDSDKKYGSKFNLGRLVKLKKYKDLELISREYRK